MTDFQSQVNVAQSPAVAGDFASKNPRKFFLAGPGGLVAGASGVVIGRFAWATAPLDGDGAPATVYNTGVGLPSGFVHREQQGLITTYLSSYGMTIQAGFGMSLTTDADLWVKNDGLTEALVGMKAFVKASDGTVSFATTGAVSGGASGASASIAAETWSATLSTITGNILDTSAGVVTGSIYPGSTVASNGVGKVVSQLTGTPLGAGTYLLDTGEQTVTSATIGGTYGLLSNGTVTGVFAVGQVLTGTGVVTSPPTVILALATGAGASAGTSVVNNNTVVNSTTIVGSNSLETKYYARSNGLAGELVKISPTVQS